MLKKRIIFYLFVFSLQLLCGCSCSRDYIPFEKGELGKFIKQNFIWAVKLPYDSEEMLDINLVKKGELLITEFKKDGYHLTKINQSSRNPKYIKLKLCGDLF